MPAIGFICPDSQQVEFEECFGACTNGSRCMSPPTLKRIARQRPWKGKPSTTQLINGTRLELLKLTRDYYIDPQQRAFALLGTKHHAKLEDANFLMEERFEDETLTGIMDYYDDETRILYDFKSSGSFKVAKAVGIVSRKVPDSSGATYKRNGKGYKKGDPKMITVFETDPTKADMMDWTLQLNRYRLFLEDAGFPVREMIIQATVRDGGTYIAQQRGIDRNIYLIPVPRMKDKDVKDYFSTKAQALHEALRTGYAPKCNDEESWEGRRCAICEVYTHCQLL